MDNKTLYTRCPTCSTAFKVTDSLLQAAGGKVRCGACLAIFQATDYLLKNTVTKSSSSDLTEPEHSPDTRPITKQSPVSSNDMQKESDFHEDLYFDPEEPNSEEPIEADESALMTEESSNFDSEENDDNSDGNSVPAQNVNSNEENDLPQNQQKELERVKVAAIETTDKDAEILETETASQQPQSLDDREEVEKEVDEPSQQVFESTDGEEESEILDDNLFQSPPHNDSTREIESINEIESQSSHSYGDSDEAVTSQDEYIEETAEEKIEPATDSMDEIEPLIEEAFSELDYENEAFDFDEDPSDFDEDFSQSVSLEQDSIEEDTLEQDSYEQDPKIEEIESFDELSGQLAEQMRDNDTEPDPLDEFDKIVEEKQTGIKSKLVILVVAVLLIVGIVQIWTNRQTIAWSDSWGGTMKSVCGFLPCDLKPKRDVSKIKLLQRELSPDENKENFLDIKILLINEATFAQPYPTIKIAFSNKNGVRVSEKSFPPSNYLEAGTENELMPSGSEVHIHFKTEVTHPDALGFEFTFK